MSPTNYGVASLAVVLFYLTSSCAKPLTQSIELSTADSLHYFGQAEVQDFELVSPQVTQRRRRETQGKHIEAKKVVFTAFRQNFDIDLEPTTGLVDAGMLIHEVGKNGKTVLSQPKEYCLYVGKSIDHKDSTVSASVCGNKLEASIATDKASFQLQPLKTEHKEIDGPTHMVVRRSINTKACNMDAERSFESTRLRRKRSTAEPIYVDASVVADDLMYKSYGNETNNYLLTILNQVAGLLKDPSLDVQVNLKISNIKIVKTPQPDLSLSEELEKSLESFCSWQKKSDSDISILITRRDLVSVGNHNVTGKAADVGGACDPTRRCLIGQDHGPSGLIFTLAHEIGHSLGMYHDGGLSDCANEKNIMASINSGGPEAFRWSECSNNDLLNFLARPDSKCLRESKSLPDYTPSSIPMPGFYYNATEQCAMTYNTRSTVASEVLNKPEICKALVCINGKGIPESTNVPPLDGTRCGSKRDICIHGECLKVYSTMDCAGGPCTPFWLAGSYTCQNSTSCEASRSVLCVEEHDDRTTRRVLDLQRCPPDMPSEMGICSDDPCRYAFFEGEFSPCLVTCGTGVQVRDVFCQDRVLDIPVDDVLCTQTTKPLTSQLCNGPSCQDDSYNYFVGLFQPCPVVCGSGVQQRSVTCQNNLGDAVAESFCVNSGLVRPSSTQNCNTGISCGLRYVAGPYDMCSVTCGVGSRTRTIFCVNSNNVVLDITQCQDAQLVPLPIETSCALEACPTLVYTAVRGPFGQCSVDCGTGTETRVVLCININQQVDLQNCINAGLIDLELTRSCTRPSCQPAYRFEAGQYSDCSVTCGVGQRIRSIQCLDQTNQVVDIGNCLAINLIPPEDIIICILDNCPIFIYQVGEFGPCNEECGDGLQLRPVTCINNDTKVAVGDANCAGERPSSTQLCNLMPCNTMLQFAISPFSACNCSGLQMRLVICIQRLGSLIQQVSTQVCLDAGLEAQPTSQACTPPSDCVLPNPVWLTTSWSPCGVSCGIGTQTREVYCIEQPGSINRVDDSLCVAENKPSAMQECNTGVVCPTAYLWLNYAWSPCSVTCGEGFESRDVMCFSLGDNIVEVDDSLCNAGEKPNTVRPCSREPCTASWTTSQWSQCSVTCGTGIQTRTIACQQTKDPNSNILDQSECITGDRPSEVRSCFLAICPSPFGCETTYMLEGTVQYTESSPGFIDGENYPNDLDCSKDFAANVVLNRRRRRRNVNDAMSTQYSIQLTFTAFDVESSVDCTVDYVEITDILYNTSERLCGNSYNLPLIWTSLGPHISIYFHSDATVTRPGYSVIYSAVEKEEPAHYVVTDWSECSESCGEGVETREVLCFRGNKTVDESECSKLERPVSSQPCQEEECIEQTVCSGNLLRTEDNAVILSPDFPSSYSNNVSCHNVIRAPEGMIIEIYATFFNLRPEDCNDRIKIKDANVDGDPLVLCGHQAPGIVFTTITNEVSVWFKSGETGPILPAGFGFSLRADFANQPQVSCGNQITESGRAVYSPNYPGDYNLNENCLTVIRNDEGCIRLRFLDVDLPSYEGECRDFVQMVDLNEFVVNTGPMCGNEIPTVFYSFTGLMTLRFFSDENGPTSGGFNAVVNFVDCFAGVWLTGMFGECSATCGIAYRNRTIACRNPELEINVDPEYCPPEIPESVISCDVPECPSCDVQVLESGEIGSPNSPSNYDNNQQCSTEIINPVGCISINFLAFDLQLSSSSGECNTDFLEITDVARQEPIKLCGSTLPDSYQSLSGSVHLLFQTDASVVSTGYYAYVSFIPCPVNAYITGNWSECSVTCGFGMRTRDVQCMDLINNGPVDDSLCRGERPLSEEPCMADQECPSCDVTVTESGMFVTSPGFPEDYAPNLECVYTFVSSDPNLCVRLTILEANLGSPDDYDRCNEDYLEITSQSRQPALRFCPESARSIPWYSRDNTAIVRFVTDDEEASAGFNLYNVFGSCPEYDFFVGDFNECNARCGGGMRTRLVTCISLIDGSSAPDELCPNQRPMSSIPCNTEPCPVCDDAFFPGDELIMSPGFSTLPGQGYETLLDCTYNITNPDGCLFLTFLNFRVQSCDRCECDYLSIIENGDQAIPPLCGNNNDRTWASTTGNVKLNFVTDNAISAAGFNIYVAYVDCPDVYYFIGEYSECDVFCSGGTQTRDVYCRSRTTGLPVDESMCAGIKPLSERPCGEDPCPFCDEVITDPSFISSPDYPENYPVSINCNYAINAPVGQCVSIAFLIFELQSAEGDLMECQDYVQIKDPTSPTLDRRYCGFAPPNEIQWRSRNSPVSLDFYSDKEETYRGFRAYVNFVDCPVFGYVAEEFSRCSRPCGGGTQTREVSCRYLPTQVTTNEDNCNDEKPAEIIPCNLQDCPECDEEITETRQSIYSLNYPQPYFEYSCNYIYTNPGGCIELLFVQFEMPIANAMDICDKDYLLVEDMSDRPFSYRICGNENPNSIISRGPGLNVTLVTDGNPATFGEGYQLYNLFTDDCPEVGYITSDFEECDRQCGFGTRTREVTCIDLQSGITVDESLCTDDKPRTTELCNTQPCPSCDQVVDTFQVAIDSPDDLDPQRVCKYTIESDRCIRATFLAFNFPGENTMCGDTFVQLQDEEFEFLTERFCGDGPGVESGGGLYAWESRSSEVVLTLNSGSDIMANNRFRIFLTETNCPQYGYVAGEFSDCTMSCGLGGVQTRTIECQRLADNFPIPEEVCTDPKPDEFRLCAPQPPCPSCDMFVTEPETLVQGPPRNSNWTTNVRCQITVEFDTSCVVISGLEVMLSQPDENDVCVNSSLTFYDNLYPDYTQTICGSSGSVYRALTNRYIVDFYSLDYENSEDSFSLFVQGAPCPTIEYKTGEFTECSVSCGGGVRTRNVTCVRTDTMEEVPEDACEGPLPAPIESCNLEECPQECGNVITSNTPVVPLTSPGRPTYVTDADCTNNIVRLSGCIILSFLSLDIEAGSMPGICDKDYLEIIDTTFDELNVRLCGDTLPSTAWRSKSGLIRTRFVSDNVDTQQPGYTIIYTLTSTCPTGSYVLSDFTPCSESCDDGTQIAATRNCVLPDTSIGTNSDCPGLPPSYEQPCNMGPCPQYYYYIGDYSPCSVNCGSGTQMREVECRRLDNDSVVDDSFCTEVKPGTSIPCNLMDCMNNAFVLSNSPQSVTVNLGDTGTIQSLNFPSAPPLDLNAQVMVTIPANTLLRVTIDNLELMFASPCTNGDFLRFSSGVATVLQVCQNMQLPFDWFSGGGDTEVTISIQTSSTNTGNGFMGRWTVINAPPV